MPDLTQTKDKLSPSDLSPERLMALPGPKALEAIIESPMPARLVQSLAEEDFFWLVQDIGPEDALPILARASNEQWQYLLDIELWPRDRMANDAVTRWLDLLMKADAQRFVAWGIHNNLELVELHLFKNIEVRIKEDDESPSDFGDDFFSLDDVIYIRIPDDKNYQTLRQFLEHLAALPFEEAVGIYQHTSPEKLLGKDIESYKQKEPKARWQVVPVSSALLIKDHSLFALALKHVDDDKILEQIQIEFASLCNQIISADSIVARNKADLAGIVRKACGYLDVALEELAAGNPEEAAALLDKLALNDIFRVGYGAAVELKWKADRWIRKSWFNANALGLDFWEENWAGMLDGLSRKRPLFYTGFSEGAELYRDFKSLEEIKQCHKALDQVMGLDHLLSAVCAHASPRIADSSSLGITYKNLLLTSWARHHLGFGKENKPVTTKELRKFFRDLWTQGNKPYRVEPTMKEGFTDWLTSRSGFAPHQIQGFAGEALDDLFEELEKEYGTVSLEDLDPRYVKHFLVVP
jgi:hypothetical protein